LQYFKTVFLESVSLFIRELDEKTYKKLLYTIENAEQSKDPKHFKKLNEYIWEFRLKYQKMQIRLLAFWDKTDREKTLVVVTHGFIKKSSKVPMSKIEQALVLRNLYFDIKK
jgi:phage-related protein